MTNIEPQLHKNKNIIQTLQNKVVILTLTINNDY